VDIAEIRTTAEGALRLRPPRNGVLVLQLPHHGHASKRQIRMMEAVDKSWSERAGERQHSTPLRQDVQNAAGSKAYS
jgi:hypothetical protein